VKRASLGAFLAAFFLAACSGGGGSSPSGPAPSPTPTPTSTPTTAPHYRQVATLVLGFTPTTKGPSRRGVRPQYVSPGADSLTVTVNTVNGAAPPSWVTPNPDTISLDTSDCTSPTQGHPTVTCTVTIPAPPGTVNYTFQAFKSGATPLLLAENTQDETIPEATAVTLKTTLRGVVSTLDFGSTTLAASTSATGVPSSVTVDVVPVDAAGFAIVNGTDAAPFDSPITVTDGDTSGQTTLSVNGGVAASAVQLTSPTDTLVIKYTGEGLNPFDLTASGTNQGGAPDITGSGPIATSLNAFTFPGLLDDLSGDGNIDNGSPTLFFAQASGTGNVTVSELGWTNAPYDQSTALTLDPATCGSGPAAVAAAMTSSANTFTITALNAGICKVSVTDGLDAHSLANSPGIFYISVTAGSIGVSARGRK
jgi:hypothetical protein